MRGPFKSIVLASIVILCNQSNVIVTPCHAYNYNYFPKISKNRILIFVFSSNQQNNSIQLIIYVNGCGSYLKIILLSVTRHIIIIILV